MKNELVVIQDKIILLRGKQIMIDRDLAELYGIETKVLNQAVKRNIERFPEDFMFTLDELEKTELVTNCDRFKVLKHSSTLPHAFTEQGVAMLSSVLKSHTAVEVNIQIMRAFISMRHFLQNNAEIFTEMNFVKKQLWETVIHQKEADKRIDELFKRMDKYAIDDEKGIFFQGQIFDAYANFESFIAQAKNEIILIDGYVDLSILQRFAKKNKAVSVVIYTDPKTSLTVQDIQKFNSQYPTLTVKHTTKFHDRFLIIDKRILYHIGASLKDLGKKCFAFDVFDASFIPDILGRI